jgi:hypothetical protein
LEKHLDPSDIRTPLHGHLAKQMALCVMGADLEQHGELTDELEKEYEAAIEARDAALKEFGFDHDPLADFDLTGPVTLN